MLNTFISKHINRRIQRKFPEYELDKKQLTTLRILNEIQSLPIPTNPIRSNIGYELYVDDLIDLYEQQLLRLERQYNSPTTNYFK